MAPPNFLIRRFRGVITDNQNGGKSMKKTRKQENDIGGTDYREVPINRDLVLLNMGSQIWWFTRPSTRERSQVFESKKAAFDNLKGDAVEWRV